MTKLEFKEMWNRDQAFEIINKIQVQCSWYNFHCLLGGSVLNYGTSLKDLDLYFLPLNNEEEKRYESLIEILSKELNSGHKLEILNNSEEYIDNDSLYHSMLKANYNGKRIDIFII